MGEVTIFTYDVTGFENSKPHINFILSLKIHLDEKNRSCWVLPI
jgi:hypothetical protein